jgi:hypothetical protein
MRRRNTDILLIDLFAVLYIVKERIKGEFVGKYCDVFCTKCELIISQ